MLYAATGEELGSVPPADVEELSAEEAPAPVHALRNPRAWCECIFCNLRSILLDFDRICVAHSPLLLALSASDAIAFVLLRLQ